MIAWAKLALALLPGGLVALAARAALRCRHRVEVAARLADGGMGLACAHCGRVRHHPWAGEPARYRQTCGPGPRPSLPVPPPPTPTGIEREAERAADEDAAIAAGLLQIEWRERREEIKLRVMRRYAHEEDTPCRYRET